MEAAELRATAADVAVTVETLQGGTHFGLAVYSQADDDFDEVDVDFLPGQGPRLPLGEEAALLFSGGGLTASLVTYGRVLQGRADCFR